MKLHPNVVLVQKLAAEHGLTIGELYKASLAAVILEDSQCLLKEITEDPNEDQNELPSLPALIVDWSDAALDDHSGYLDDVYEAIGLLIGGHDETL